MSDERAIKYYAGPSDVHGSRVRDVETRWRRRLVLVRRAHAAVARTSGYSYVIDTTPAGLARGSHYAEDSPMNTGWICPRCHKSNAPTITTCDCHQLPVSSGTVAFIPSCLHDACPACGGSGIRKDGLGACIHGLSCPCPKCTIR